VSSHSLAVSRRHASELCLNFVPPENRGRRESRVSDAPAASCAKVESTRVVTTGSPVQHGFPCAMVLTAYFVLSPVTGLFCHRRFAKPGVSRLGRAGTSPQDLTPASGRQDHTTSPSASASFVCPLVNRSQSKGPPCDHDYAPTLLASTASRPAFVTIMIRPSGGGTAPNKQLIWVWRKQKYFCKGAGQQNR
jgi:hypothetical protein